MINIILSFIIALLLSVFCTVAAATEKILDFHSDIMIFENAGMQVTENITVQAEGNKIRRGIYRDFPTRYKDKNGNNFRVDFEIEKILRDGNPEPWHAENNSNGVRIYIGRSNKFLQPGTYSYVITYRTNRQLGYFDDHDELY